MNFVLRSICSTLLLGAISTGVWAQEKSDDKKKVERPKATELLPHDTLLFVQVNDVLELREAMTKSTMGQMINDEKMAPFVQGMWGEAKNAYEDVKEEVAGLELEDLANLPQGEVCFAMVKVRRKDPAVVFFIDIDPESETAGKLIDKGRTLAEDDGAEFDSEDLDGVELHSVSGNGDEFFYFETGGSYVFSSNRDTLIDILSRIQDVYEGDEKTLSENRKFATILNRCKGTKDVPPEMSIYVDPIELIRETNRQNAGVKTALAFLPYVGVDGLLAVGGAAIYDELGYDSIFHMHILMASPRKGFLDLIALKPGINDPESFVPEDVISYMTSNWNVSKTWNEIETIYEIFTEEGAFQEAIETGPNEFLNFDLKEDLIDTLDGRATVLTWSEPPSRLNSQCFGIAVKIKDKETFEETFQLMLDKIAEFSPDLVAENRFEGISYWTQSSESRDEQQRALQEFRDRNRQEDDEERVDLEVRQGFPCVGMIGDFFVFSDSEEFFKVMIQTHKGDKKALVNNEDYKKIMREMENMLGTQAPSVTFFNRPAEQMRTFFEAAKSENTKALLDSGAEDNDYVRGIRNVFEDNPLPEFKDIERYFPPAGGFITSDDSGFHLMLFNLKPGPKTEGSGQDR